MSAARPVQGGSTGTWGTELNDWLDENLAPVFNVMGPSYGATGDGVTNDRAAIQAAIDAASAAGGGTVYFPKGTYVINTSLTPKTNVNLIGADPHLSVLKAGAQIVMVEGLSAACARFSIQNLGFDLNSQTDTHGIRFYQSGSDYITIRNCEFKNIDSGTGAISTGMLLYAGSSHITVEGCTFLGPGDGSSVAQTATGIWCVTGAPHLKVLGCTFEGVHQPMWLIATENFLVANNHFIQIGIHGITIAGSFHGAVVGNVFRGTAFVANAEIAQLAIGVAMGVDGTTRTHHVVVADNEFYYDDIYTATAVSAFGSHHVTIQGNNMHGAGIEVNSTADALPDTILSEHNQILDNNITGPGYGTGCWVTSNYTLVRGNIYDTCEGIAVTIADCNNTHFLNNVIRNSGSAGSLALFKTGPLNLGCQDIVIAGNDISGGVYDGINIQDDASHTRIRIEFNYVMGNAGGQINVGASATHVRKFGNITANGDYDANTFALFNV